MDRGRRGLARRGDDPGRRSAPRAARGPLGGAAARPPPPQLQPRRAADPRRELLPLPRARQERPQGRAEARPRGDRQGHARVRHGARRGGRPERSGIVARISTRRRSAECRSPRAAARGSRRSRSGRCGAGSRRAPGTSRTGRTCRRRAPRLRATRGRWAASPIDAFVLAGIEKRRARPFTRGRAAPTLLRRLYFDLVGLPPTRRRSRPSSKDVRADAYESLVDRLLASPHFGERMALLLARPRALRRHASATTATTRGAIWPYRDYVIDAFNDNMPFDRFTVEQLAGDLLPERRRREQRIASGFNRLLQTTEEGGAQAKEYRGQVRRRSRAQRLDASGSARRSAAPVPRPQVRPVHCARLLLASRPSSPTSRRRPSAAASRGRRCRARTSAGARRAPRRRSQRSGKLPAPTAWRRPRRTGRRLWPLAVSRASTALEARAGDIRERHARDDQGNDVAIIASTSARPEAGDGHLHGPRQDRAQGPHRAAAGGADPRGAAARGPGARSERQVRRLRVRAEGRGRPAARLRHATASTPDGDGFAAAAAIDGNVQDGGWAVGAADGEASRLVVEFAAPVGATARRRRSRSCCTRTRVPCARSAGCASRARPTPYLSARHPGPSRDRSWSRRRAAIPGRERRRSRSRSPGSTGAKRPSSPAPAPRSGPPSSSGRRCWTRCRRRTSRPRRSRTRARPAARQLAGRLRRGRDARACRSSCRSRRS